ncbi:squalene synthase HpnC [Piscinibacter sakaiensis]|uniref:squalene synthase HpnC n=1 Tax=Piscinibacter sakaiensis TaxID=1547922 RepID=UPI003AAF06AD
MQQRATREAFRVDNARVSVDHYENFPVASLLCPPRLRPAVAAIYWFARTADDLADEGDVPAAQRLADLAAYRADLLAVAAGNPPGPRWQGVFTRLGPVIAEWSLPLRPFTDLLSAFEQDVTKHRYRDRAELLDYCRRSADPVGRLLLHLYRVDDADALRQSDAICSALQLINFWQDLRIDLQRGRIYLPLDDCERHRVDADALLACRPGPALNGLLADEVDWARGLMAQGAPLVHRIGGRAGWELRLVVQGGLRILDHIAARGFDTLAQRPRLGARDALPMLWRALRMRSDGGVLAGAAR